MIVYDVHTDLDPDQLTAVAKETYRMWLAFALGQNTEIGETLLHPTGRYAASISWKFTGQARVAIIADEKIAPEGAWIESGTDGADMTQMLREKFKIAADGHRYRVIPLRPDSAAGPLQFDMNRIVRASGKGERLPVGQGRIWATPRPYVDGKSRFRTMREDTMGWQVPPMAAYQPAMILKHLLELKYGARASEFQ